MDAEQAVKCGRGEDPDLRVWTIGLSVCFVPRSAQVELGWSQPPALRGKQRSGLTGKAECGAPSCQSSGAEAHLCVILAFDVTLRHWGGIMWLLQTKIGEQRNRWVSPCISVSKRSASYNKDAQKGPDVCACGYVYLHLTRQSYVSQCACFLGAVCGFPPDFGMLQGNLCFPKLPWLFRHRPMAVYYLFMCWSLGYNNSSNSTEKAFLIQCRDSECGMKNSFQPLQELAAAASQESPWNPSLLLISQISFLGYRPPHTSNGNSGQDLLGGNLVPRAIVLLLGFLHGCQDCSVWGWRNSQIQRPRWQHHTGFVCHTGVPVLALPFCTQNPV